MKTWSRVALVLVVLGTVLFGGCSQVAEKAVEQTTGVQVSQKGDVVTVKGKDGESATFGKLPEQLKDFPIPQGFTFDAGLVMTQDGKAVANASWKGKSRSDSVVEFYRKGLADKGWKEGMSVGDKQGMLLLFTKGDEALQVVVADSEGKGEIDLNVSTWKDPSLVADVAKMTPVSVSSGGTSATVAGGGSGAATAKPSSTPVPEPTAAQAKAVPTPTLEPPKTTDASALPAEIKALPQPSGFSPLKDGSIRVAEAGKFKMAAARLVGKGSVKEVGEFYQKALVGAGWSEEQFMAGEDEVLATFANGKEKLELILVIQKAEAGTEITVEVGAAE